MNDDTPGNRENDGKSFSHECITRLQFLRGKIIDYPAIEWGSQFLDKPLRWTHNILLVG
jgi:hypothetical protein